MKELLERLKATITSELFGPYFLEIDDEKINIDADTYNAALQNDPDLFLKCLFDYCDIECKKEVFKDSDFKYRKILRITFIDEGIDVDLEDEDLFDMILKKGVR